MKHQDIDLESLQTQVDKLQSIVFAVTRLKASGQDTFSESIPLIRETHKKIGELLAEPELHTLS